jgi:hypothetical protein
VILGCPQHEYLEKSSGFHELIIKQSSEQTRSVIDWETNIPGISVTFVCPHFVNPSMRHNSGFKFKSQLISAVKSRIEFGIDSESWLLLRLRNVRFESIPIASGIVPFSSLLPRSSLSKFVRLPIASGMLPLRDRPPKFLKISSEVAHIPVIVSWIPHLIPFFPQHPVMFDRVGCHSWMIAQSSEQTRCMH